MATRDIVEANASHDERAEVLRAWAQDFDFGVMFMSYHRLQVEHYVYSELARVRPLTVADIAQEEAPRRFLQGNVCQEYITLGLAKEADGHLDLLKDPPQKFAEVFDAVICTEVLEHVRDPFKAARCLYLLLKPGGMLIGSTPFCWADHHTSDYADYWRYTEQGLDELFSAFDSVTIKGIEWTTEGAQLYELIRRFEGYGLRAETSMSTGLLFRARKGEK